MSTQVDNTENAVRALRYAIALALEHPPIPIQLVIAIEHLPIHPDTSLNFSVTIPHEKFIEMQTAEHGRMLESGEKLLKEAGVPYATEILRGPIASTIAERADALGCDGIVMGTRGMTALKNLVLGSVATNVVHASQLPVTLVK